MTDVSVPAFPVSSLQFLQGTAFTLPQKTPHAVYVLESWATWCPPCRQTIPHLNSLSKQFANRGVVFVGITSENDEAKIRKFISSMGDNMTYPVALDKNREMDAYARHFGAQGIPHCYVVDCMGVVRWQGHPAEGSLANKLDVLANERMQKIASEEDSTSVPPKQLTAAMLSSLSVADVKWALKANHLTPSDYLEKSDMLRALLDTNQTQATKLRGKIAVPGGAGESAASEGKSPSQQEQSDEGILLKDLTSEQVSRMGAGALKKVIRANNINVGAMDGLEKSDLVKAVLSALEQNKQS